MYDFYNNPPKNKKELREWLVSWLQPSTPSPPILEYKDEKFIQEAGFKRAFHIHGAFRNLSTNEYVWWVFPDEEVGTLDSFPKTRYPDFETMLESVINDYYVSWKLTD